MAGRLLLRGMLAGVLAGLLSLLFAEIFGEPQIGLSIAFESARDAATGVAPEPEIVSRAVQRSFGLLTATLVYGAAFGGLFSLVFTALYGRIASWNARHLALLLASAGFLAVVLVPDLKYPPNPPAVGAPETIGVRTALYFEMVAISLAALTLAVVAARGLAQRWGGWNGGITAAALFIAVVWLVQLALPEINEVPDTFPAVVLWRFRAASIGMQLALWSGLGLVFGALAERLLERSVIRRAVRFRA